LADPPAQGKRVGGGGNIMVSSSTCLVKVDVARKQQQADSASTPEPQLPGAGPTPVAEPTASTVDGPTAPTPSTPAAPQKPNSFSGSVSLRGDRVGRDAGRVADEVLGHLVALSGSKVTVTMEITVDVPGGIENDVVRIVSENANSLKFSHHSFEREE
jgi:hypothetical protein